MNQHQNGLTSRPSRSSRHGVALRKHALRSAVSTRSPGIALAIFAALSLCLEAAPSPKEPVKIIFDTDMGSDCDDVGALALLHAYADQGKAEILGCIYSSGKVPYGAAIIEAINIYYGRPDIPIGAEHSEGIGDPDDKMLAEKLAKDTSAFGNAIIQNSDAIEQTKLNRQLLAQAENNSITYITVGHTKGLHDLMASKGDAISPLSGKELVRDKLARWIALGALNANNDDGKYVKDWNFAFNGTEPFTHYLVENFPKEAVFISDTAVMTGESLKGTPAGNIVRTAYRDWLWNVEQKTLDDQRPSWDLLAVFYAIEGLGHYMLEEEPGYLDFVPGKGSLWIRSNKTSNHRFIYEKANVAQSFSDHLNQLIAKPPALAN